MTQTLFRSRPFRTIIGSAALCISCASCHPAAPEAGTAPIGDRVSRSDGEPVQSSPSAPEPELTSVSAAKPARDEAAAQKLDMVLPSTPAGQPVAVGRAATSAALVPPGAPQLSMQPLEARRAASGNPAASAGSLGGGFGAPKSRARVALAPSAEYDREAYAADADTGFVAVRETPLSTFSIDVDTASYANVRRFLQQGQLPPPGAVRIEELVNYFPYAYADPAGDAPFSVTTEVSQAPWNPKHELLHVGLQSRRLEPSELPPQNLVFLVDVSGSMQSPNKLPLLRRSLATLTERLRERDQVAMVVYAGASGLVLPPTSGEHKAQIAAALDRLEAGGSTNGGAGIELAYSIASGLVRPGASTRVILATDGDFNVGATSQDALVRLISERRKSGVFLSVLGFGMGNLQDSTLELLADRGNGNYAYVDSLAEARKVLVAEAGATLITVAQDVKLQLEFNPENVGSYRLIGYENRRLEARDFNDDQKDAGELGAGHGVTALYELIPPGELDSKAAVDATKYQSAPQPVPGHSNELCTIKLRYKRPGDQHSQKFDVVVRDTDTRLAATSPAFRFAAAVASFGMTLRRSPDRGSSSFVLARELARGAMGQDVDGYQREFVGLIDQAEALEGAPLATGPLVMP